LARTAAQIDPHEPDPIRGEIRLVSDYMYAWALWKYAQLPPLARGIFKRFVRRFPELLKAEFAKAKVIKKSFLANDIFSVDGRTRTVIEALSLRPVDERIYLAAIVAA